MLIRDALGSDEIPRDKDGKITILELGIGGGESLKLMSEQAPDGVSIIGVDLIPELAHHSSNELGIPSVVADVAHLPFRENSISAVNASAIFHEVSSYGIKKDDGRIFGLDAVKYTMAQIQNILLPGGLLAYRDVALTTKYLKSEKGVRYSSESWKKFIDWFLPEFLSSGPQMYDKELVRIQPYGGGVAITAPVGLHREIQRHYLMLRDYVKTVDGDSDADAAIASALSSDQPGDQFINPWKEREGKEWYVYGTPTEVILAGKNSQGTDANEVLFPSDATRVQLIPRANSNQYLQEFIDYPEFDGKLVVGFNKMSAQKAKEIVNDVFTDECSASEFVDCEQIRSVFKE